MNIDEALAVLAAVKEHIKGDDSWSANIITDDGKTFTVCVYLVAERWQEFESMEEWRQKMGDIWLN